MDPKKLQEIKTRLNQLSEFNLNWLIREINLNTQYLSTNKKEKINAIIDNILNNGLNYNDLDLYIEDSISCTLNPFLIDKVLKSSDRDFYFFVIRNSFHQEFLGINDIDRMKKLIITIMEEEHFLWKKTHNGIIVNTVGHENYERIIKDTFKDLNSISTHIDSLSFIDRNNNTLLEHCINLINNKKHKPFFNNIETIEKKYSYLIALLLYHFGCYLNLSYIEITYHLDKIKKSYSNKKHRLRKKEEGKRCVSYMLSDDAINALTALTEGRKIEKSEMIEQLILNEYKKTT